MRIEHRQAGHSLKVTGVARQQREAVGEGRGGNEGIGQLDAVLLAQADGVLNGGFVEGQFGTAADELAQGGFLGGIAGPN